ncbi:hypothetical protein M4951_25640 [Blastopirellula sp. J2-11]|uniref:hypothetical protein n=1 Tax=Blastopirellula sp. J2-11 TaxID=2943192 RepID=UPI0021CA10C2|nr:hypothetical protein [Blastopirellula sp. J2-11]UUO06713.1 hypothetical protein M4951_25640 [Blastopirellula sp. J2-11]
MANSPTFPHKPTAGAGRSWPILFPLIVFSVVIAFVLFVVCSGGFMMVSGTQFHPAGFRIRRFVALRLPVVGTQAGRTSYTDETPKLSQLLVKRGWISKAPLQTPEDEWDLIELDREWRGIPSNLTDYLRDENSRVDLYAWSEANPLLAGMLWSEVEHAAKLKLYWMAPELIDKMVDFSRRKPLDKSLSKEDRSLLAQINLTSYLLSVYQKTEDGAKAAGETQLAADCRKQIERLSSVGVVIPEMTVNPAKSDQPKPKTTQKPTTKKSTTSPSEVQESSN